MVLATSRKTQDEELPLGAYPPIARGMGVVVEGVCLLVVPSDELVGTIK